MERPAIGQAEEFVVGDAAPEKERDAGGQFVVVDAVGGAGRGGKPSAPARPGAAAPKKAADASSDLARRIEERRKQMREDAERLRNGAKPAK